MLKYGAGILALAALAAGLIYVYKTPPRAPDAATFAGMSLTLNYATTSATRERGLGGRMDVPEGYGMLFVFGSSSEYGFWMKDMRVPIDIFWLGDNGRVVSLAANVATSSYPSVFYPSAPARYVLETAAGFARAHAVATGTPLIIAGGLQSLPAVSQ